jgi:hypothetical protein
MAHTEQLMPVSRLGFQVKAFKPFLAASSLLGGGTVSDIESCQGDGQAVALDPGLKPRT